MSVTELLDLRSGAVVRLGEPNEHGWRHLLPQDDGRVELAALEMMRAPRSCPRAVLLDGVPVETVGLLANGGPDKPGVLVRIGVVRVAHPASAGLNAIERIVADAT